jgi:hypothetical protein
MASCGVSVNLSAVESSVTAHLSKITGLGGLAGLPYMTSALLAGMAISNGNYFAAINMVVNVDGMLDAAWSGMREGFGELVGSAVEEGVSTLSEDTMKAVYGADWASRGDLNILQDSVQADSSFFQNLTKTVNDWGGKVTKFADETGLSSLSGYVDINMLDLAKSSIGMGASFDECDFGVSGIGNYFSDPATGSIKLLSNYAPKLGDTSMPSAVDKLGFSATEYLAMKASAKVTILGQQVSLKSVYSSFVPDEVTNLISISAGNVSAVSSHLDKLKSPAKGAYGDGVRRLASGEMVVENAASALDRLQRSYIDRMPVKENSNSTVSLSAFVGSTS